MVNEDFCTSLETKLNEASTNFSNEETRGFWCDGALPPAFANDLLPKHINDKGQITMSAYLGKTGQDKYVLLVKFGQKSLHRYARGLAAAQCLPDPVRSAGN